MPPAPAPGRRAPNPCAEAIAISAPSDRRAIEREARATANRLSPGAISVADAPGERSTGEFPASGSRGRPLPAAVRSTLEPRFDADLRDVRVHTDALHGDLASGLGAYAFAHGDAIAFAPGRFAPGTSGGMRLLCHELTHVLQQRRTTGAPAAGVPLLAAPLGVYCDGATNSAADAEIDKIEAEKLPIGALLDRCEAVPALRDQMIEKVGDHAGSIHEERQLAALLATKFKGTMRRADFANAYRDLLGRLPADQRAAVLDRVGPEVVGVAHSSKRGDTPKWSINDIGIKGTPGSSIKVGAKVYVVTDLGVQFKKVDDVGGPAGRNNNPGNITVDDWSKQAWDPAIGAYAGRSTDSRFAVFPTPEAGRAGAIEWATKQGHKSVLDYFGGYAPKSEGENKPTKYADTVVAHLNAALKAAGAPAQVQTTTPIRDLEAIGRAAGIQPGKRIAYTVTKLVVTKDAKGAEQRETVDRGWKADSIMQAFVNGQLEAESSADIDPENQRDRNIEYVARDDPVLPAAVRAFTKAFDESEAGKAKEIADKVAKAARDGR